MIFENFPKNPEKCLKVTHFWEFGCTQNVSLLRMTVYMCIRGRGLGRPGTEADYGEGRRTEDFLRVRPPKKTEADG